MSAELHPEIVELQARLDVVKGRARCKACSGHGTRKETGDLPCGRCGGTGREPKVADAVDAAQQHLAQAGFQWGRLHRGIVDAGLALRASLNAAREAIVKLEVRAS